MRYIVIDIETTGLDPDKNQILEVAAIIAEWGSKTPVAALRCVFVDEIEYTIGRYCMKMHRALFDEIESWRAGAEPNHRGSGSTQYIPTSEFDAVFRAFLAEHGVDKVIVAGKSVTFDLSFLTLITGVRFSKRILDPTIFFIRPEDTAPPDLATCCSRAGIEWSNRHTALSDAMAVLELICHATI